jgi:MFS superfamily sulfate permease-like transporter
MTSSPSHGDKNREVVAKSFKRALAIVLVTVYVVAATGWVCFWTWRLLKAFAVYPSPLNVIALAILTAVSIGLHRAARTIFAQLDERFLG